METGKVPTGFRLGWKGAGLKPARSRHILEAIDFRCSASAFGLVWRNQWAFVSVPVDIRLGDVFAQMTPVSSLEEHISMPL